MKRGWVQNQAPELFTPANARAVLATIADALVGPLGPCPSRSCGFSRAKDSSSSQTCVLRDVCERAGVKTLDPEDPDYRPAYNNDDNSNDYHMANGFSYHQGPVC